MPVRNQAIDPATSYACKGAYDLSKETGFANNDPISTLTDQSAFVKNLTGVTTTRPLFISNQINGYGVARWDGTDDVLSAATAADWKFLHDGHGITIIALVKQNEANPDRLNAIVDTCAASSANAGILLALDDRSSVPRNNGVYFQIAKASVGNNILLPTVAEAVQPLRWHLVVARYANESRSLDQYSLAVNAAEVYIDGLGVMGAVSANLPHSTASPANALKVGATSTLFAKIDLAGLWLFDTALPDDLLASYLRWITRRFDVGYNRLVAPRYSYNAFPTIARRPDGTLLEIHYEAMQHATSGAKNRLVQRRSSNNGWDWSLPAITLQDSAKDVNGTGAFVTRTGTILVTGFTDDGGTDIDAFVLRSTDQGLTWSAPITPTHGLTLWSASQGNFVQLSNGDILLSLYGKLTAGTFTLTKTVKSSDDGLTWGSAVTIADGPASSKNWNESSIVKISGTYPTETLLAMVRNETDGRIDKATSTDSGATWGSKTSAITGTTGFPMLFKAASGNIYCLCRSTASNKRSVIRFSTDNGATWSASDYQIDGVPGFNDYSWGLELSAGRFLIVTCGEIGAQSGGGTTPSMSLVRSRIHNEEAITVFT